MGEDKRERFKELWPDHKLKEICEKLGVTRQTGSRWRRELGLPYKRKPFTKREVKFIKDHPNPSHSEIARRLERPHSSIIHKRKELGSYARVPTYEDKLGEIREFIGETGVRTRGELAERFEEGLRGKLRELSKRKEINETEFKPKGRLLGTGREVRKIFGSLAGETLYWTDKKQLLKLVKKKMNLSGSMRRGVKSAVTRELRKTLPADVAEKLREEYLSESD